MMESFPCGRREAAEEDLGACGGLFFFPFCFVSVLIGRPGMSLRYLMLQVLEVQF